MRDLPKALETARRAARDHSRDLVTRINLAEVELASGNFETSIAELDKISHEIPHPLPQVQLYYALANLLSGDREKALSYFDKYAEQAPAFGAIAKADFALSESRLSDAEKLLEPVIASAANPDAASLANVLLAEARLRHGDAKGALTAAAKVTKESSWLFFAALTQLAAGDEKSALDVAQRLDKDAAIGPRVMTKWLYGEAARLHKKPDEAIAAFRDSLELIDAWFGHYLLARAYIDVGKFTEANHELEICLARQGEGSSVFFDDITSLRFASTVPYYVGRAQQGLGNAHAAASYKAFLATQNGEEHDPLVEDAKKRSRH
jgi:tetratricopeptide (TPR) repeat protein